jgi:ribose 1,5-bisphosphokinase
MNAIVDGSQRLIVIVGPSGAGKDSIIRAWLAAQPLAQRAHHARRTINRPVDQHEDHEVVDSTGFRQACAAGEFAFHWQAHGLDYGVRHAALAPLVQGHWVVLNGSRAHLPRLRAIAPLARAVMIDAPEALRAHGRSRTRLRTCTWSTMAPSLKRWPN